MKSSADSSPSSGRQARLRSKYGVQFVKSKACAVCNLPFGVLLLRHSCRFCGRSVCNKCSPEKRLNSVSKNPKRICSDCLKDEAADECVLELEVSKPIDPQSPKSMGIFVAGLARRNPGERPAKSAFAASRSLSGSLLRQRMLSSLRLKLQNKEITPDEYARLEKMRNIHPSDSQVENASPKKMASASPSARPGAAKSPARTRPKVKRPPPVTAATVIYIDDNPETEYLAKYVRRVELPKEGRGLVGEGAQEKLEAMEIDFADLTAKDVLVWDFDCSLSAIHLYKTMHMDMSKKWEGQWGGKLLDWWCASHPKDDREEINATEVLARVKVDPVLWNEFVLGHVFGGYLSELKLVLAKAQQCKHVILSRGRAEEVVMALLTTKLHQFFNCVVDCSGCYYRPKQDFELGDTAVVYDDTRQELVANAFIFEDCKEVYDKDRWIMKELETGWRRSLPGYVHGGLHALISETVRKKARRKLIANEIQSTEKAYVDNLKLMMEAQMQLLQSDSELISTADVNCIFSNMKELVNINLVFLQNLDQLIEFWDDEHTCLGTLFTAFADHFKLYSRYASSFDAADQVLSKALKGPAAPVIDTVLTSLGLTDKSLFRNILIMPVQRVPRYKLFVVELLKNTHEYLPDHARLQKALVDIKNTATFINTHIRLTSGLIKAIKLSNRFRPKIPWLVQGNRGVVHKGALRKRGTGINQALKNRYFALFSDGLFMYFRQQQAGNFENMHFTHPRPVALRGVETLVRCGQVVQPAIKYETARKHFRPPLGVPAFESPDHGKDDPPLITRDEILALYPPSTDLHWICIKGWKNSFWMDAGDEMHFDEWMEAFECIWKDMRPGQRDEGDPESTPPNFDAHEKTSPTDLTNGKELSGLMHSTTLDSLVETDTSSLSLCDREQHFTQLSEALWRAYRAGKKTDLTEKARELVARFLKERMDPDTEAQLRNAIAKKRERLLAAAFDVCGTHGYITDLVLQCRELQEFIVASGAGVRDAIQKCDPVLLREAIDKSENIGYNDGDTVHARGMLQRIERLDQEAAKVNTEAGCIGERANAVLEAARVIGYNSSSIKELQLLVADPVRFLDAQYKAAVSRQDCDYAIAVAMRRKDIFMQRHSDELELQKCSLLRAPKEWASDTLMGRRTRASMFLQCQTHPHAPLTTRCTSPTLSDAKVAKRVYELVRHNHRTVMKCLGQAKTKRLDEHLRHLLQTCRDRPDLQDELFLVIMKQCRGGINPNVTKRAFKLLSLLFKAFAPSSELENFVEMFIRSKPSLEAEYNLRELLRRRVYEQEAEGSWGHQEFNGSEGTIKSPYGRLKIRASPRMLETNFVAAVCNGVTVRCTAQVSSIEDKAICLLEIVPSTSKEGDANWFRGYIKPAYFMQGGLTGEANWAAAEAAPNTTAFELYKLFIPDYNERDKDNASWLDLHKPFGADRPKIKKHPSIALKSRASELTDKPQFFPIVVAAAVGLGDVVSLLRKVRADTRGSSHDGYSPLSLAAAAGHKQLLFHLQALGADINAKNKDGTTPMILAAQSGQKGVLEMLQALGADVGITDANDNSPIIHAASAGHDTCVATLADMGADVTAPNAIGLTAMMLAATCGHKKVVSLLHVLGANFSEKGPGGVTPILAAASEGHTDVLTALINLGADVNVANGNSCTPMLLAALGGHRTAVEKLHAAGARVDVPDAYGNTPLLCAFMNGHLEVGQALLMLNGLGSLEGRLELPKRPRFSIQRKHASTLFF